LVLSLENSSSWGTGLLVSCHVLKVMLLEAQLSV
jgi:hypothetical protein